jgi:hypothetical protein
MPRKPRKVAAAEPPPFDAHALIARMRAGDEEARAEAYRIAFGNDLGRFVLTDILAMAGVGQKYGGAPDLYSIGFHQGGHDLAVDIAAAAGFDQASLAVLPLTETLEGPTYEPSATPYADPDPELDDGA